MTRQQDAEFREFAGFAVDRHLATVLPLSHDASLVSAP